MANKRKSLVKVKFYPENVFIKIYIAFILVKKKNKTREQYEIPSRIRTD